MITKVQSFKTSDGVLHADKTSALKQQLVVDVRAIVQANDLGKGTITTTGVGQFVQKHVDEIYDLLLKYRQQVRAESKK